MPIHPHQPCAYTLTMRDEQLHPASGGEGKGGWNKYQYGAIFRPETACCRPDLICCTAPCPKQAKWFFIPRLGQLHGPYWCGVPPLPHVGSKLCTAPPQLAAAPLFSAVKIAFCSFFQAIFYASLGAFSGLEISTCGGVGTRRTETRAFIGQMFARYITIGGLYRAYVGL